MLYKSEVRSNVFMVICRTVFNVALAQALVCTSFLISEMFDQLANLTRMRAVFPTRTAARRSARHDLRSQTQSGLKENVVHHEHPDRIATMDHEFGTPSPE
jgi:hypothetical protein